MLLLIDNYDSFSYNLYQMCGAIQPDIRVVRNNAITLDEIRALAPSHIILSPGPGRPCDAGICEDVIRAFAGQIPLLGVCLGHQAICETFGGTVTHARRLMHGKQSVVSLDPACPLFAGLPDHIPVARYHSLIGTDLPDSLTVVSTDSVGEVMAVMNREKQVYGLQFHPESILTPDGAVILEHFLAL
ncbi:MAG TPA: aminodeoxychorismate/anthranilate synthase component II [Candidatus Butyricicoccus stercorigallinarum]|nr:aminodeoxychorismate/anthranilate synthase component II [Candidatus Butyricicoccus stercorigallinarum]